MIVSDYSYSDSIGGTKHGIIRAGDRLRVTFADGSVLAPAAAVIRHKPTGACSQAFVERDGELVRLLGLDVERIE